MRLDLRSLALLRIGLAALVILDLLIRATDFAEFYGDRGLLPRAEFLRLPSHSTWFCAHLWAGGSGLALIWLVHLASAVALMVGYRTRWAALLTWYLTASLQLRNPFVLDGGDDELRLLLFWLPLLPCGERFSLDGPRLEGEVVASPATLGYGLQIFCLYFFAGLFKTDSVWTTSGQALYYLLSLDVFVSRFGRWLLQFPQLLHVLTFASLGFERLGPLLLLIPRAPARLLFVVGAVALHLGIACCLHLGIFPAIAVVGVLGLLPSGCWPGGSRQPATLLEPRPLRWFAGAMCVVVLLWNGLSLYATQADYPKPLYLLGYLTREYQRWELYAPRPMLNDG